MHHPMYIDRQEACVAAFGRGHLFHSLLRQRWQRWRRTARKSHSPPVDPKVPARHRGGVLRSLSAGRFLHCVQQNPALLREVLFLLLSSNCERLIGCLKAMWEQQPSPRTPILFHWLSEDVFTFSPVSRNGANSSPLLLAEDFSTPQPDRDRSFVIIPLHTPPKQQDNDAKSNRGAVCKSSMEGTYCSPVVDDHIQLHRRSPEKRFHSPGPICRICHEGDKEEALLSPCNCSGSMLLVHKTCLERWLSTSNSDHCELCMKQLPIQREARPMWQWFSMATSSDGPQGFYADLTCVILLTPLCILSIYLCAIGAADYMRHGVWEGTGLAALSCFLLATYLVWCYITIRFHWQSIKKWRTNNQVIHLVVKDCRRRDHPLPQGSDSATPRSTMIVNNDWNSSPEVRVFSPQNERPQALTLINNGGSQPNVLDASIRGFNVPAIL